MMKANEVRKMNAEELNSKLGDLKKDLFQLRLQHATNQLENPAKIAEVKKDIARVKTILRELQLAQDGLDSGNILLDLGDLGGILELIGGMLKTELEQVLLQVAQLGVELLGVHLADFICLHHYSPPFSVSAVSFFTILHLTGSL